MSVQLHSSKTLGCKNPFPAKPSLRPILASSYAFHVIPSPSGVVSLAKFGGTQLQYKLMQKPSCMLTVLPKASLCCVQTWHLPLHPLSSRRRFLQIWDVLGMMNSTCQKIIRPRRRKIYIFLFRLRHLFAIWHLQGTSQVTSVPFLLSQTSSDCEF